MSYNSLPHTLIMCSCAKHLSPLQMEIITNALFLVLFSPKTGVMSEDTFFLGGEWGIKDLKYVL